MCWNQKLKKSSNRSKAKRNSNNLWSNTNKKMNKSWRKWKNKYKNSKKLSKLWGLLWLRKYMKLSKNKFNRKVRDMKDGRLLKCLGSKIARYRSLLTLLSILIAKFVRILINSGEPENTSNLWGIPSII